MEDEDIFMFLFNKPAEVAHIFLRQNAGAHAYGDMPKLLIFQDAE